MESRGFGNVEGGCGVCFVFYVVFSAYGFADGLRVLFSWFGLQCGLINVRCLVGCMAVLNKTKINRGIAVGRSPNNE